MSRRPRYSRGVDDDDTWVVDVDPAAVDLGEHAARRGMTDQASVDETRTSKKEENTP